MKLSAIVFVAAVMAGATATQSSFSQPRNKALYNLKAMLESIKNDVASMKPAITSFAGLVDMYADNMVVDTVATVEQAYKSLDEKNIPAKCLSVATTKLDAIRDTVVPECSIVHVAEDAATISYNTLNFVATSMMYFDEVLNGFELCKPWYEVWHFIPCTLNYVTMTYNDLSGIITKASETFEENEAKSTDIINQLLCKANKLTASSVTAKQVIEEAYLCAKNGS